MVHCFGLVGIAVIPDNSHTLRRHRYVTARGPADPVWQMLVIARNEATKQSRAKERRPARSWIASWSLSSGAHPRDPLARNDVRVFAN
jgi:hypothetical protein